MSQTDQMVLFGGIGGVSYNDTWVYGAGQWSQLVLPTAPLGRSGAALVGDLYNGRLVVHAGRPEPGGALDDVWELSMGGSKIWDEITPHFPPHQEARLVEDTKRQELIAYASDAIGDTWVFTGDWNND